MSYLTQSLQSGKAIVAGRQSREVATNTDLLKHHVTGAGPYEQGWEKLFLFRRNLLDSAQGTNGNVVAIP